MTLEEDLLKLTDELQQEAQCIPNMTHPDVPIGIEDCSTVRKMVYDYFERFLTFYNTILVSQVCAREYSSEKVAFRTHYGFNCNISILL